MHTSYCAIVKQLLSLMVLPEVKEEGAEDPNFEKACVEEMKLLTDIYQFNIY